MQKSQKKQGSFYIDLQKYDTMISNSGNDIGQTDLIEMHIN